MVESSSRADFPLVYDAPTQGQWIGASMVRRIALVVAMGVGCGDNIRSVPDAPQLSNDAPVVDANKISATRCPVRVGGAGRDFAIAIAADVDGSVVTAGYVVAPAVIGIGEPRETTLATGMYVARHDADCALTWVKVIEGAQANPLLVTPGLAIANGRIYLATSFAGTVTLGRGEPNEISLTASAAYDGLVAELAADGALVWARVARGARPGGIAVSPTDGSLIVTGAFRMTSTLGPGEPNETTLVASAGMSDAMFIAIYAGDGSLSRAWQVGDGRSSNTVLGTLGLGVAALPDGTFAIAGMFASPITVGSGQTTMTFTPYARNGVSPGDLLLARYASDGTLRWATQGSGNGQVRAYGVAASRDDGSLFIAGMFRSYVPDDPAVATFGEAEAMTTLTGTSSEGFVARFHATGVLAWAKSFGGPGGDLIGDIVATVTGGAAITGAFGSDGQPATFGAGEPGEVVLEAPSGWDIFGARLASDGSLISVRQARRTGGTSELGAGLAIAVTPSGSMFATGVFTGVAPFDTSGPAAALVSEAGSQDAFLVRWDP